MPDNDRSGESGFRAEDRECRDRGRAEKVQGGELCLRRRECRDHGRVQKARERELKAQGRAIGAEERAPGSGKRELGADRPIPGLRVRRPLSGLRPRILLACILMSVAATAGFALDASFSGSYKSFSMGIYDVEPFYGDELYGTAENSLRLQARIYPSRTTLIETAYSIAPRIQSESLSAVDGTSGSADGSAQAMGEYRAYDLDDRLYPWKDEDEHSLGLYQNLDRAYGGVYLPFGDLYVGRQAISWGNAHVINPTNILAPFSFTSLNTEHTRGVDAARLRMPLGAMGEVDLGYVAGDEFDYEKSAVFARGKTYLAGTDLSLLVMDFRENLMVGLDAAGSIGGAGSWVEAAYVLPGTFSVDGSAGGANGPDTDLQYLTASAGVDYNFGEKLYGYAEYHFNSPGKSDPGDYAKISRDLQLKPEDRPAYSEGSVYLLGRHYLGLGGTYKITPLLPVSGLLLVNASDLSANLSLSMEYNFTGNVYLEGGAYLGLGEEPKLEGELAPVTEYESEFGAYPDLYYLSVKLYF